MDELLKTAAQGIYRQSTRGSEHVKMVVQKLPEYNKLYGQMMLHVGKPKHDYDFKYTLRAKLLDENVTIPDSWKSPDVEGEDDILDSEKLEEEIREDLK